MAERTSGLRFLEDRWDEAVAAKLDGPELLRYRSNLLGSDLRITNFGGGNTSSKLDAGRSAGRKDEEDSVGEGQRRRSGQHQAGRVSRRCIWTSCWRLRRHTAVWSSKTRWWRCIRCARLGTIRWRLRSIRRCMGFCRFRMWIICIRTGVSRWRLRRTARSRWRSSTRSSGTSWRGCRGSGRGLSWA